MKVIYLFMIQKTYLNQCTLLFVMAQAVVGGTLPDELARETGARVFGPEDWEAVTDMEVARRLCTSSHLREQDGKIMAGDSWLAMKPKDMLEQRNGEVFARSNTMSRAISGGETTGNDGMADLHRKTATKSDPVGVSYSAKLEEEQL